MRNHTPDGAGWFLDEFDGPRFWARVEIHGGIDYTEDPLHRLGDGGGECWLWEGNPAMRYGQFKMHGRTIVPHRVAYRDFGKRIDDDQELDHLCRNTKCVNPNHVEPVAHVVNVRRGKAMKRAA